MKINLSSSKYWCVISPTNGYITNLNVVCISLPHPTFYEHHLSKLVKWLRTSICYGLSYHAKKINLLFCCRCEIKHVEIEERKAVNAEFLNLVGQIDSEIHLPIILQEVRKELRHGLLLIIQSRNKMQKSTLAYEATIFCSNWILAILNWAT